MATSATILIPVDESLRYVLYGLSIVLEVELRASEIERLFAAAEACDSDPQEYEFHSSRRGIVSGHVDEHEPESVWLSVQSRRIDQTALDRLVNTARHASFGLRRAT